ncbi:MAG: hypothetical protein ABI690_24705 [Chloroflexota bacterium]
MELLASQLRAIADQMGLPSTGQIAKTPGVSAVYRLTVRYHDRRAADSVATLRRIGKSDALLEIVYRGLFNHKPVTATLSAERYNAFVDVLQKVHFDNLGDQQNIPPHGVDLWLLERGAGTFNKSVILAPELTGSVFARLVYLVGATLPEAIREVKS